jgi:D-alanyl-D-alanine carboxypeptidase
MSGQCHLEICFEDMPEGQWLLENAHKYGFIIRYPKGKEHITTYQYEPWHLRYVGKELATELRHIGQAMEEFFALVD